EVVRPSRTVPRAILMGLLIIAALYVGLQLVAQGTLGDAIKDSKAPLVESARVVFGSWGGILLAVCMSLSASGCIASDVLSTPRVPFAIAQQGQLPRQIASVHPRFGTPYVAIILYAVICAGLALSGSFKQLAIISSSGTLVLYLICCLGVLKLRAQKIATEGEAFVAPGGPVVPVLAAAIIVWMLSTLSRQELVSVLVVVAVLAVAYAVVARRNASSHRP
ncbi:MAG: APC family permease, partial [Steroidobacterales bacterium]